MADDIDHWLDQLAGRARGGVDDPLDQSLIAVLHDVDAPREDELGLRRLLNRLESEGLLRAAPPTRHRPRWLAVAASLMLAVSLGWWMLPEQGLRRADHMDAVPSSAPVPDVETDPAMAARRAAEAEIAEATPSSPEPSADVASPPPAPRVRALSSPQAGRSEEHATAGAAEEEALLAEQEQDLRLAQREKMRSQALSAFAATPPVVVLPANEAVDLDVLRAALDALDGVDADWLAGNQHDALRLRWTDADARERWIAALPAGSEIPRLDAAGQAIVRRWVAEATQ